MAQQNINVGTVSNDGTGDTLRAAFIKTQNNFSEFYAAFTPALASNNATVANTLFFGNSTVNASVNSSTVFIGNTASFFSINSTSYTVGNSTANVSGNSISESIANSTAVMSFTPTTLTINAAAANLVVGNTTTFVVVNSQGITVSTNTLALGTVNATAHTVSMSNGYVTMPNGMKYMWGTLATANTTGQVTTFATTVGTAFSVNAFSVSICCNSVATMAAVTTINSTAITLITNNATAQTIYWNVWGI